MLRNRDGSVTRHSLGILNTPATSDPTLPSPKTSQSTNQTTPGSAFSSPEKPTIPPPPSSCPSSSTTMAAASSCAAQPRPYSRTSARSLQFKSQPSSCPSNTVSPRSTGSLQPTTIAWSRYTGSTPATKSG
ncbi:hypothetical protein RJ639_046246 [Escallonia herrerae]|uniref:Uncharacterized protein n=1 Tax=Escallonia herrerae TaxID=1293975 RepID=A0AA89AZG1_9ASTE|nr:hypothetical protein RJ639_046246 [Escallonia herrerae]